MDVIPINQVSQRFYAPSPLHPTVLKIESFRDLPVGWHYGAGGPCPLHVIDDGIRLHQKIINLGFSETDVFPGVDGGMLLAVYEGVEYFAFRLEVDGTITYHRETQDVEVEAREGVTCAQAVEILRQYRTETWRPSDSYTFDIMKSAGSVSVLRHMRLTVTRFRLWTPAALSV